MPDDLNLRTPPQFAGTLDWLADLPDDAFTAGLKVLDSPTYDRVVVLEALREVRGWDRAHARRVVRLLESLTDVQRVIGASSEGLARSVAGNRAPDKQEKLAARLSQLLSSPVLKMLSRGRGLAGEREHILVDARILTDKRYLFTAGRTDSVDGAIIMHSLRLSYGGSTEPNVFIALDKAHLELLQQLIERALKKAEHLEERLVRESVPYIEPSGDLLSVEDAPAVEDEGGWMYEKRQGS